MKLRNKQTGEIVDFKIHKDTGLSDEGNPIYAPFNGSIDEWEDAPKEPKEFYFIDQFMSVSKGVVDNVEYAGRHKAVNYAKKTSNNLKTAGNYFETKEEAELAVEKLKAWKRLKDKGFRFTSWSTGWNAAYFSVEKSDSVIADLDLLFSQEGGDV